MNKRLRKKKRKGEFTEYGLSIAFKIDPGKTDLDEYCDKFIDQIESFGGSCGGHTTAEGVFDFTIEVGTKDVAQANSMRMINWILDEQDCGRVSAVPMKDGQVYYEKYLIDLWCNVEKTYLRAYKKLEL